MQSSLKRLMTVLVLGLLALGAQAANLAGRVLLASGDVFAERDNQRVNLRGGTMIQAGDLLVVGDKSSLQVRFLDESMATLKSNSQLRVDEFTYNKLPATDQMRVSLVKGGLRTITGLIGKGNQDGFSLKTATATIGIRGTHFTALHCQDDCIAPDGTPVINGTYGGVTDGKIGVKNAAGELVLAQQEYFYVANQNTKPERLLGIPNFLSDSNLEARGRVRDLTFIAAEVQSIVFPMQLIGASTSPVPVTLMAPTQAGQFGVGTGISIQYPLVTNGFPDSRTDFSNF